MSIRQLSSKAFFHLRKAIFKQETDLNNLNSLSLNLSLRVFLFEFVCVCFRFSLVSSFFLTDFSVFCFVRHSFLLDLFFNPLFILKLCYCSITLLYSTLPHTHLHLWSISDFTLSRTFFQCYFCRKIISSFLFFSLSHQRHQRQRRKPKLSFAKTLHLQKDKITSHLNTELIVLG